MAWRNVWRNRRRTLVTVAATTLAFTVMILYSSLVQGYLRTMERNILDLELGDVQVHAPDYRDDPSLYSSIDDSRTRCWRASTQPVIRRRPGSWASGWAPRRTPRRACRSMGSTSRGTPASAASTSGSARARGSTRSDPYGVVVGAQLARTLVVKPGDEIILLSQASDGSTANDLFTIRGVLQGVSEGVDRAGVFMTEEAFRRFFAFPVGAHEIILRRPSDMDLERSPCRCGAWRPASGWRPGRSCSPRSRPCSSRRGAS